MLKLQAAILTINAVECSVHQTTANNMLSYNIEDLSSLVWLRISGGHDYRIV